MFDGLENQVIAVIFAVVAALLFLRRFKQNAIKDDGKRFPPSLPVLPVICAIIRGGVTAIHQHFMKSAERIGPVFSVSVGKRRIVVLNGYEAIFDALVRHSEAYADREAAYAEVNVVNPELRGIASPHYNDTYKRYHKLVLSILKEFGFGVQTVTETRILQEVETMIDRIRKQNGRSLDPKWLLMSSASNVTLSILFGKNFQQSFPKEISRIVENSPEFLANLDVTLNLAPIVRFLPKFGRKIDNLRDASKNLLSAIEVGIEFIKSSNSEPTFIGRYLEIEGTDYVHKDLLFIIRDLCLGSTDTVSTTLLWAMVELANHLETQNRLQSEIDEMVPKERLPSLDDKPRLPFTEAVILEIMRRRTLVPFLVPHSTLKDTKVLEYDVPKGCMVIVNAYSVHLDPKFWKDPENFRPERFLDAKRKIIHSHRVISFGLGRRSCLGEILARQQLFLFLTSLVQNFDIRPPEGHDTIVVKEHCAITSAPSDFEVRLIPRVKANHC